MHSLTSTELSSQTKYTPCNHRTSPRHQPLNLEIGCFKYVCVRVASPPLPTPQEAFGRRNVETCQRNSWLVYSQRLGFCWVLGHPHLPQHVQGEPADSILSVFRKWMATPSPACAFQLLLPWVRVKMHTALGAPLHCWGLQNLLQTSKTKMLEDKWETTLHKEEVDGQDSDPGRLALLTCCFRWHPVCWAFNPSWASFPGCDGFFPSVLLSGELVCF